MRTFLLSLLFSIVFTSFASSQEQWSYFQGVKNLPGNGKNVVLVSGDEEYRSEQFVTQLGKILATRHGFDCYVLYAIDPKTGTIDPVVTDNIPGLEILEKADVAIFFLRFRNLPDEQMKSIDAYLKAGKPLLGVRTSTHAFNIPADRTYSHYSFNYDGPETPWKQGFGRLVLGETWIDHHGHHKKEASRGVVPPEAKSNKIVNGCEDIFGPTDVYKVRLPLPKECEVLVLGEVLQGMNTTDPPLQGPKNDPKMPIAWTKPYQIPGGKPGRVFTSTMGSAEDLLSEGFRRLLVNATYWLADLEAKIPERANVELVGTYEPLPMGFAGHQKNVKPF